MWTTLPMMTCPHCEQESQIDDYYELDAGDEITCPKCEKDIKIITRDISVQIEVRKP